jgi:molybdopterin-guanine dinucleotide biosynthesis protein A
LPADVRIVFDRKSDRGPLEGLAVGLATLANIPSTNDNYTTGSAAIPIAASFVTSCDAPLLRPEFVRRMIELLDDSEAAVPRDGGRLHPLVAVYRLTVLPKIERRLAADQLRLTALVESLRLRVVGLDELRDVDPQLKSLENVNDPEAYRRAILAAAQ